MPIPVTLYGDNFTEIRPTESWQTTRLDPANRTEIRVDPDYYVIAREVDPASAER
jgi:hypothetical protein